ncbi:hypothetical protein BZG04_00165 [Salinivibrio kushneri]|nr:hypothetical protein BZG04_00165 [Salinivibrio kushneri]OOE51174.1 hypothetical protein BZG12_12850 [Salinivibrio kushneri]
MNDNLYMPSIYALFNPSPFAWVYYQRYKMILRLLPQCRFGMLWRNGSEMVALQATPNTTS